MTRSVFFLGGKAISGRIKCYWPPLGSVKLTTVATPSREISLSIATPWTRGLWQWIIPNFTIIGWYKPSTYGWFIVALRTKNHEMWGYLVGSNGILPNNLWVYEGFMSSTPSKKRLTLTIPRWIPGFLEHFYLFGRWSYPLVNVYIKLWKDPTFLMDTSTISIAIFKFADCKRLPEGRAYWLNRGRDPHSMPWWIIVFPKENGQLGIDIFTRTTTCSNHVTLGYPKKWTTTWNHNEPL